MPRTKAEEAEEKKMEEAPGVRALAREDICRLISHVCNQCIDGKTRENPAVLYEGIAALYQAVK